MLLNLPFVSNKIETIDFKAFINKEQPKNVLTGENRTALFSSIPFNPSSLVDPLFIGIVVAVLLIALAEKRLADSGNISIASFISVFLKISFPAVGIAALWYLMNSLKFLF